MRPLTEEVYWPKAAFNAMRATRWQLFCARWFGKRIEGRDAGCIVVGYRWRGKLYMTEVRTDAQ